MGEVNRAVGDCSTQRSTTEKKKYCCKLQQKVTVRLFQPIQEIQSNTSTGESVAFRKFSSRQGSHT